MDQLIDFGERADSEGAVVLMRDSPKDVDTGWGRWAENSISAEFEMNVWD
jgi:hypothetical protein